MNYNLYKIEEFNNLSTYLYQSNLKISFQLPIYIKGVNNHQLKYFKEVLHKNDIQIVNESDAVILVEKIIKEKFQEENIIEFATKQEWFLPQDFLIKNEYDPDLIKFEVTVHDIQQDVELILKRKHKQKETKEEMGKLLYFPSRENNK